MRVSVNDKLLGEWAVISELDGTEALKLNTTKTTGSSLVS
jgi:hypothetical protein